MTPDAMAALHGRCFTVPRPWSAAEIAGLLQDPQVFAIPDPAGFLLGRCIAGEAELLTVAVAPEARRQGIGARLVGAFLRESAVRQAEVAFLEVAETNAAAIALYSAQGFAVAGRRRAYYRAADGRAEDALVMSCAICPPSLAP